MRRLLPKRESQLAPFRVGEFEYIIHVNYMRHQYYRKSGTKETLIFDSNWLKPFKGHLTHTKFSNDYFAFIESIGEDGSLYVYRIGMLRPTLIFQINKVFRFSWGSGCIYFSRLDKTLRASKV